ncbi:hypothetical protein R4B61_00880 [Fructilactobacillus vespulae]|uniref:hypothetical protein n=1 Tax=Fructilactobacillus vespulae TaxID=1249630 RepID=UPI0039B59E26
MEKVQINRIQVGSMNYKMYDVFVNYQGETGIIESGDPIIDGFMRDRKRINVVKADGELVHLLYQLVDGQIVISNPIIEIK